MRKIDIILIISMIIIAILIVIDIKTANSSQLYKEIQEYYKNQAELKLWVKNVQ